MPAHRRRLRPESAGLAPGTLAIANLCAWDCTSSGLIGDQVTEYYAMIGKDCVLLLCGGDKRKQSSDITKKGAEPHETQSQHFARRGHHSTAPQRARFCSRISQGCLGR